ncbi:MAG: vanadium-dependent haloperoxidase [Spirosomataceae bacterium]
MIKKIGFNVIIILLIISCKEVDKNVYEEKTLSPKWYHETMAQVTDVIIHDILSPPVASRVYSYVTLAGYEALVFQNDSLQTNVNLFKGLTSFPKPEEGKTYSFPVASFTAMLKVAKSQTFTLEKYDTFEKETYEQFEAMGIPSSVMKRSKDFGGQIADHVIQYAKGDNYLQTRGLRYTVKNEEGKWVPTPPQYGDAMEPYWPTIRPSLMDSAGQFPPAPVIRYSKDAGSPFQKEVKEVYETVKNLTEEQKAIAWFWDDNAFVMNVQGHVTFANKKMTPGGHWIAITRTLCENNKASLAQSSRAYMAVATALHEGFISSWHEKYKSEKIRPETVINTEIDPNWEPYLQTPPFPEYASGHSTISSASAEVLTAIFGDNVAFTDSTEYKYGHGVRSFTSVRQAATECSYSRLYGGIHYRSGCEQGQAAGIRIGQFVIKKLELMSK